MEQEQLDRWCNSAVDRGFESRSDEARLKNWYLLLLREAHSINEKEQRLVGSESE